ncbi:PIG-L deacetylase family protein [Candidatus Uabimicrobium sp. HlEnr_7]|uniref:PIG-L deacetylase family protein n=1 Tax=Candidatus Uabimicrobium helgolandensis TaxID=3095367 RepID=UPI00355691F8
MIKLHNSKNDIFVPDGIPVQQALERTTHLCISAHQDDNEILAYHGIVNCFQKKDHWFTSVIVSNGSGSPRAGIYADTSDEEMQRIRIKEQKKAAFVGEYAVQIQLGYPSTNIKDAKEHKVVEDIHEIIKVAQPHTIYLHNPADKHDTHIAVLLRSLEALRQLPQNKRPKQVYGCEVWRGLDWLVDSDKKILAVGESPNIAQALVGVFDSQISGGKRYDLATAGRRLANATYLFPHEVDKAKAITYAMDLTPLVQNETLCIKDYTIGYLQRLQNDVSKRFDRLS